MFACDTIMFMKRNDMILAAVVSAFAIGLFLLQHWKQQTFFPESVAIYREKEKTASYPLNKDAEIRLYGADGGENLLIIKSGQAWIETADCPDGLCVQQGRIDKSGQSIICLPHRLVVAIEGGADTQVDAVAR